MAKQSRLTVKQILQKKRKHQKITVLTAYDFPLASLVDQAGIDIVLVGDSLANVVLGLDLTRKVGMTEMIYHAKAVNRAVKKALLIGDMPFNSYKTPTLAVKNAKRFVKEAGCNAVKLEWFDKCPQVVEAIARAGIPVMGHVGLTPQSVVNKKGFKVRGTDAESATKIIEQAITFEKKGCFSIVLECIPDKIAEIITDKLKIPAIGIGAGVDCDGQVLVIHDLLGLYEGHKPKFVKQYANLSKAILKAVTRYRDEVLARKYPSKNYSFTIDEKEIAKLKP